MHWVSSSGPSAALWICPLGTEVAGGIDLAQLELADCNVTESQAKTIWLYVQDQNLLSSWATILLLTSGFHPTCGRGIISSLAPKRLRSRRGKWYSDQSQILTSRLCLGAQG